MSFVTFARSRTLFKGWNGDSGQDGDGRDYDEQLNQGEGALGRGRGTFGHDMGVSSASYCAWAAKRKRKRAAKARLLDKGFCIRCM